MIPVFKGKVENGILKADISYYKYLNTLEGRNVDITVRRSQRHRTIPENRYYRGVVVPYFAEFTGYDPEEAHMALRQRFLSTVDEHGLMKIRSTTDLTTVEFEEYMTRCRRLGDELGFYIPLPNEVI